MKLILYNDHEYNINDVKHALEQRRIDIIVFSKPMSNYEKDPDFEHVMEQLIEKEKPDLFFSIYYYPLFSDVCLRCRLPYAAWVCDSPTLTTYSKTIHNACNYVFLFDRQNYYELKNRGVETVYHLPLSQQEATATAMMHSEPRMKPQAKHPELIKDPQGELRGKNRIHKGAPDTGKSWCI